MKQTKGKGIAKASRRATDENRCGKKLLRENVKIGFIKGELDEDKLNPQKTNKDKGGKG